MKTLARVGPSFCLSLLFAVLLSGGCFNPSSPATMASAERFKQALDGELQQFGTVESFGGGSGQAGNVLTKDYDLSLPTNTFPPDKLYELGKAAMAKWGEYDSYSTRGNGGGGNRFHLQFGDHRSRAFIDLIAYTERDKTKVNVLIRVFE